jgi:hypothetical protein
MQNNRDDLRATGQAISRDAEQIEALEAEKAALDPADPRLAELSERVEHKTAELADKAAAESELVEAIGTSG